MTRGLKITFEIHAILGFIFGIAFFLIPETALGWIQWTPVDPALARLWGAALIALGMASYLGYHATRWEEVRITVEMDAGFTIFATVGALYAAFVGGPAFLWVVIVVFGAFAAAWLYQIYQHRPVFAARAR